MTILYKNIGCEKIMNRFWEHFSWIKSIAPFLPLVGLVGGLYLLSNHWDHKSNEIFWNSVPTPSGFQRAEGKLLKRLQKELDNDAIVFTAGNLRIYVSERNSLFTRAEFDDFVRNMKKTFAGRQVDWDYGQQAKKDIANPVECYQIDVRYFEAELVGSVLSSSCLMWDGRTDDNFGSLIRISFLAPLVEPKNESYNTAMAFLESYSKMVLNRHSSVVPQDGLPEQTP